MIAAEVEGDPLLSGTELSGFQVRVILLCAFVALVDGFDTQAIAFSAPVIVSEWDLNIANFGGVFAAGLFGGLIGAVAIGRLADKIGRKPAMLLALLIMGIGSLLAPFATDLVQLTVSRVIAGFGLGGALPCAIALTTEYAPARLRTSITTAMFCAFPFGAIVGAIASAPLLQAGEWRALFWIGGAVPLAMIPLIWIWVPESLGWLRQRGRTSEISAIAEKLGVQSIPPNSPNTAPEEPTRSHAGLSAIVADGRLGVTVSLGTACLVSLLLVYLLVNWVPALTVAAGGSAKAGAFATALLNMSGIIGGLVIAWIADRKGGPRTVAWAYLAGAVACAGLSFLPMGVSAVFWMCAAAGLLGIGAQMCLVSLGAAAYPLHLRASAVGVLMAVGRIGAIIGPLIGSALIGGANGYAHLGWTVAIGCLVASIALAFPLRRK